MGRWGLRSFGPWVAGAWVVGWVWLGVAEAQEGSDWSLRAWKGDVTSKDATVRAEALRLFATLKGAEHDEAKEVLTGLVRLWDAERTKQEMALARWAERASKWQWSDELEEADVAWATITDEARVFIDDVVRFPPGWEDPTFNGPFTGSDWVYAAEERAAKARAPLLKFVDDRRKKVRGERDRSLRKRWESLRRAEQLSDEFHRALGQAPLTLERNDVAQATMALLALRMLTPADAEPWTDAVFLGDAKGTQWVVWFAWLDAVERWNATQFQRADKRVLECVGRINSLRALWRLPPLQADARLEEAAWSHCEEQQRLGYYDHTSPTPGRAHYADRAQLAGYGPLRFPYVLENIDKDSSLAESYDRWRWDGGHYRTLVDRKATHLGLANHGAYNTLVVAAGLATSQPVLSTPDTP